MTNINLIYYLIAGATFGAVALKTVIPSTPGGISGMSLVG